MAEEEEEVAALVGKEMREEEGEGVFLEGRPSFSHGPLNVLTGPRRRNGASVTQPQQRWMFMKYGASTRWKTSWRALLTGSGSGSSCRNAKQTAAKTSRPVGTLETPEDVPGNVVELWLGKARRPEERRSALPLKVTSPRPGLRAEL